MRCFKDAYLDFYSPQVLRDVIRMWLVFWWEPSGLLLLFDAVCSFSPGEMVALEFL